MIAAKISKKGNLFMVLAFWDCNSHGVKSTKEDM
jgi:hypothetical protein